MQRFGTFQLRGPTTTIKPERTVRMIPKKSEIRYVATFYKDLCLFKFTKLNF